MRGSQKKRPRKQPQKGNCPSHKGGVKLLGGETGEEQERKSGTGREDKAEDRAERNREKQRKTEKNGKVRKSTENRKGKRGIEIV